MTDIFKFGVDMTKAKNRRLIRKTAREIGIMIMSNGQYLEEITIDRDIQPVYNYDVHLGNIIRAMEVTLRFHYGEGRVSKEGNQSDKDKKRP